MEKNFFKKISRSRWALIILLIAILTTSFYFYSSKSEKMTYKEFPIEPKDISVSILSTGTVQPKNRLEIKAPIPGRIDQVLVQEGQYVKKGEILALMSSIERAALIDAARSQGPEELKKWQEIYRPTPILAPLPGMIIRRDIEPGQTITSSEAVLVLSDQLTVNAQVDETDLAKIKINQEAEINLDAYPDQKINAKVDQIAFEAKTVNNVTTYAVNVIPLKTPGIMRSGMTANVNFLFENKKSVLAAPNEVLLAKEGVTKVLKKTNSKEPLEVEVQLGVSNGKYTEILSGLSEGDIVLRAEVLSKNASGKNPFSPLGAGRRMSTGGKH